MIALRSLCTYKATNDEGGEVNVAFDYSEDAPEPQKDTIPAIAKRFKARGQPWALVGDENYGEGLEFLT